MPVRIPTDASPQLQDALHGIEKRLAALEKAAAGGLSAAVVAAIERRLIELERGPAYGDEWSEMVAAGPQHSRGLTPDPAANAGFGTERVLHENGTWRRPIDGLVQVIPEGVGRPSNATRVVEVLADLAIAGSVGANAGDFRRVRVNGQIFPFPPPGAALYNSTDWTHNSTGNWIKVSLNTALEDNGSLCDTTNSRVVCKTAGVYLVSGQIAFNTNATGIRALAIYKNGSAASPIDVMTIRSPGATTEGLNITLPTLRLAVNNYVELYAFQSSGGNLLTTALRTFLAVQWVRP